MLELIDVSKIYRRDSVAVKALDGVSLKVEQGEFAVISGQSGSGKITLMAMLGCLDSPTSGEVIIGGVDVSRLGRDEVAAIRNKKLGFVFQQFNLIPTLNALDNVALPLEIGGWQREPAVKKASELLDKVGLTDRAEHFPSELSGGQMQRVAIARALANNPEIILADEPTGNLDSKTGEEVMALLQELNKQGKTIVLITHDVKLASKGKRHFVLKDGKIIGKKKFKN